MKRFRILISSVVLLLFLVSCSEKEVSEDKFQKEIDYVYIYVGDEENPYTGKIIAKYENGEKKWEVNYKDGIKEGIQTDWYPNGEKMLEGMYKNGKKEGTWTMWDKNGKKTEIVFKEGWEISSKKL